MEDFIVPPIEQERPLPSAREASETAFYAAAASKENPVHDYITARTDLETTGNSDFVNMVKQQWDQEQDAGNRQAIEGIIGDNTISPEVKKSVLTQYAYNKYIPGNLKDRFIQKTAANETLNNTVEDTRQQDFIANSLALRQANLASQQREYDIAQNRSKLQTFLSGISHLYKGAGNTLGLVSDEDYKKGHEEFKKMAEENPLSAGLGNVAGLVGGAILASPLGILGMVGAGAGLAGTARFAELGTNPNVTDEDRLNSALAEGGLVGADFALPIFKAAGIMKAMVLNGAGAVTLGELNTTVQNKILEAYPELQQKQFDPKSMTINALLGALIGGVFGRGGSKIAPVGQPNQGSQARRPGPKSPSGNSHKPETYEGEFTREGERNALPNPEKRLENKDIAELAMLNGPSIPPGTPATVAKMANPKIAESLGILALKDSNGTVAQAMGTDRGAIVHDWVLPKIDTLVKDNPDLASKIHELDNQMQQEFNDFRYDPNIVNATKREQDLANIFEVIKSARGGYYQQSNSIVSLPATGPSEGIMVFGPNATGKFVQFSDAAQAKFDLEDSLSHLDPKERGVVSIAGPATGPWHVEWKWKREYDDISIRTFGPDSIHTSVLGMDVSNVARSAASKYLFPTGVMPKAVEQGAIRGIERDARLSNVFIRTIKDHIAGTKFGKELDTLINDAEEQGIEAFSKKYISARFPDLSERQVDQLFEDHTYWRRMQHYMYNFANRIHRNKLVEDDMEGIYTVDGSYVGAGSKRLPPSVKDIKSIWDFDAGKAVPYKPEDIQKSGRVVVRLADAIEDTGKRTEYGIVGGTTKLSLLPNQVLPNVPGYSPRMVKERFFVDMRPNELEINGIKVVDPIKLRNYTKTLAAAKNEREAKKIAEQMQADNPDHTVTVRPERQDNWGQIVTEYQVHNAMFKQSQKRGERLPSLNGPARIEDRLVSLIKMAQSLSRLDAFSAWESSFRDAFTKGFRDFLTDGQFPQFKTDIKPLENMGREEKQAFDTAHRMYEFYSKMKQFETFGDFLWKKNLHNLADVLERWRIPAEKLRELGDKGNLPVKYSKMMSTMAYIHMNPVRQWLVQPAQLMEMFAISPSTAPKAFQQMLMVRLAISGNASLLEQFRPIMHSVANKGSGMNPQEFDNIVDAIQKSGLLESIDMNVLVHGIFREVDRNLVESNSETSGRLLGNTISSAPRAMRSVGFDAAELTNRIGLWLQAKNMWEQQNPGKNWNTKENRETISAEAMRLSGTMNKAGNLPYQEGALSVLFQFAAISQKLLMNILQDNATIMSPTQRAKLAAARLGLYGYKYGIPGGVVLSYFISQSDDPDLKSNAATLERGITDYVTNNIIAATVDPETPSDLAVSKSMTPYSEGFLPYLDVMHETWKLFDDKPSTNPRFATFGMMSSFGKAVDQMQGWFTTRDINESSFKEAALEAAELASGFNNYSKGLLLLGMRDKVTSNGNMLGMQYSMAEAYAQMFLGVQSQKEIDTYDMLNILKDHKAEKAEMAKNIHQSMMNMRNKLGTDEFDHWAKQLNSFISLLPEKQFSSQDKFDLLTEIARLDRQSYVSLKQSIFTDVWKYHSDTNNEAMTKVMDILKKSSDPTTQNLVKLLEERKL